MIYSLLIFTFFWYGSIFFHSAFLHRYSTHRSFELSPAVKKIFAVLTYLFLGSSYMSPPVYAAMHSRHHLNTDNWKDPHSPKNQGNPIRFMWLMYINFNRHFERLIPSLKSLEIKNPLWWERLISSKLFKLSWIATYFTLYYFTSQNIIIAILLTLVTSFQGPIQGFLVNWFGHQGRKASPSNFLSTDFILLGEAYHHNHHLQYNSPDFSGSSTNKDITFIILKLLSKMGLLRLNIVSNNVNKA